MLFSLLRNPTPEFILYFLLMIPVLLISLSFHECAHAFAAYKQGDGFAKFQGRMSLNPLKHLDPIGFLCLLLAGFGWAKPVPVVPNNLKHGKKSMIIVSLAGIITNILLAFLALNILYFGMFILKIPNDNSLGSYIFYSVFESFAGVNMVLAVFNLLPIPPLDGYNFIKELFYTWKNRAIFETIERYNTFILIALLLFLNQTGLLEYASYYLSLPLVKLCELIYSAFI